MPSATHQCDLEQVGRLLGGWIGRRGSQEGLTWLTERRDEIASGAPPWKFFTSFSAVPRYLGKSDLELSDDELREAESLRSGWYPHSWSLDQAARTLLVLTLPHGDPDGYSSILDQVFSTADVRESVALYQALPLLPHPERHVGRAAEGVRSNMTSVFNAVALENPYPAEYLDESAWNQMVLKAVFVGSPLSRIRGLDERANPRLARMLVDYAHERWAASRAVAAELWRPVGPFAGDEYLDDLARALEDSDELQQQAAALALADARTPGAKGLLSRRQDLKSRVEAGELTWSSVSAG